MPEKKRKIVTRGDLSIDVPGDATPEMIEAGFKALEARRLREAESLASDTESGSMASSPMAMQQAVSGKRPSSNFMEIAGATAATLAPLPPPMKALQLANRLRQGGRIAQLGAKMIPQLQLAGQAGIGATAGAGIDELIGNPDASMADIVAASAKGGVRQGAITGAVGSGLTIGGMGAKAVGGFMADQTIRALNQARGVLTPAAERAVEFGQKMGFKMLPGVFTQSPITKVIEGISDITLSGKGLIRLKIAQTNEALTRLLVDTTKAIGKSAGESRTYFATESALRSFGQQLSVGKDAIYQKFLTGAAKHKVNIEKLVNIWKKALDDKYLDPRMKSHIELGFGIVNQRREEALLEVNKKISSLMKSIEDSKIPHELQQSMMKEMESLIKSTEKTINQEAMTIPADLLFRMRQELPGGALGPSALHAGRIRENINLELGKLPSEISDSLKIADEFNIVKEWFDNHQMIQRLNPAHKGRIQPQRVTQEILNPGNTDMLKFLRDGPLSILRDEEAVKRMFPDYSHEVQKRIVETFRNIGPQHALETMVLNGTRLEKPIWDNLRAQRLETLMYESLNKELQGKGIHTINGRELERRLRDNKDIFEIIYDPDSIKVLDDIANYATFAQNEFLRVGERMSGEKSMRAVGDFLAMNLVGIPAVVVTEATSAGLAWNLLNPNAALNKILTTGLSAKEIESTARKGVQKAILRLNRMPGIGGIARNASKISPLVREGGTMPLRVLVPALQDYEEPTGSMPSLTLNRNVAP